LSTKTTTKVAHYHVQKQRRAEFIEAWRANQRTVVALEDVEMHDTGRRMRRGVYVGADGGRPTRSMDATAHEIDPGTVSTVHRHSWDAMVFCVAGEAWTEVDGTRIHWGPGDSLHLPAWSWHRHGNEGSGTARFLTFSSEPMLETMGMAILEDGGDADTFVVSDDNRNLGAALSPGGGIDVGHTDQRARIRHIAIQWHDVQVVGVAGQDVAD